MASQEETTTHQLKTIHLTSEQLSNMYEEYIVNTPSNSLSDTSIFETFLVMLRHHNIVTARSSLTPNFLPSDIHDADGVIRVGGTRVTLDTVITAFKQGATAEEIASQYPSLQLADIYTVIGYYLHHQDEIEVYLTQRQQEAVELRQKIEAHYGDRQGFRDRLLARKAEVR